MTPSSETARDARYPRGADFGGFTVCLFSQGLQESVDGWEEEGKPVSDARHLP